MKKPRKVQELERLPYGDWATPEGYYVLCRTLHYHYVDIPHNVDTIYMEVYDERVPHSFKVEYADGWYLRVEGRIIYLLKAFRDLVGYEVGYVRFTYYED